MTKSKSQLRAEAVERLKSTSHWLMCTYAEGETSVVWETMERHDGSKSIGQMMLDDIDLLADDAHESRSSYEERLYDVPVSDCPYCGCKRVVIHDFSDIYESPHSYRVEHMDEKEAFNAGCFETYYAFDSAEKAVEHANMHDLLTDEPTNGIAAETNGIPSDSPLDAQARAEIEDMERSRAVSGDLRQNVDVDSTEDAKVAQDSREKLEADIERYLSQAGCHEMVCGWLDRQASITERHWMEICGANANANVELKRQIDVLEANNMQLHTLVTELESDNDYLRDTNEKLGREVRDWRGEAKNQRNNFEQATEARKHWQRKYENLKAASYRAEAPSDESELARELGKALAERDMYRDKLGRAIDKAHEIGRLVDE